MRIPRPARSLTLLLVALTAAGARAGDTALEALAGTWGQPPIDGQPGLSGSYFAITRGAAPDVSTTCAATGPWRKK